VGGGAMPNTGGVAGGVMITGGRTASGGVIGIGGQPASDAWPIPCVPAQWECSSYTLCSSKSCDDQPWIVPDFPVDCVCNPNRPKSVEDCPEDESFVCRVAASNTYDQDFEYHCEMVAFECSCTPTIVTPPDYPDYVNCSDMCLSVFADGDGMDCNIANGDSREILCGCAWVYLD